MGKLVFAEHFNGSTGKHLNTAAADEGMAQEEEQIGHVLYKLKESYLSQVILKAPPN